MRHCLSWDSMVCPEKATPPLHYHLLPKAVSGNLFWVPLQYPGVVAQNSSHFSDDYLPVLLRFQLLVSCIMHFISSLSSVHKFSIYFHPGLRHSFTCKAGKVLFFSTYFLEPHSSQTQLQPFFATSFCHPFLSSSCCRFLRTPPFQQHLCKATACSYSQFPAVSEGSIAFLGLLPQPQGASWAHAHPLLLATLTSGALKQGEAGYKHQKRPSEGLQCVLQLGQHHISENQRITE